MALHGDNSKTIFDIEPTGFPVSPNTHSKVYDYGKRASITINQIAAAALGNVVKLPVGTLLSDTGAGYVVHDGVNTPSVVLEEAVTVSDLEMGIVVTTAFNEGKFNKAGLFEFDGTDLVAYTGAVAIGSDLGITIKL